MLNDVPGWFSTTSSETERWAFIFLRRCPFASGCAQMTKRSQITKEAVELRLSGAVRSPAEVLEVHSSQALPVRVNRIIHVLRDMVFAGQPTKKPPKSGIWLNGHQVIVAIRERRIPMGALKSISKAARDHEGPPKRMPARRPPLQVSRRAGEIFSSVSPAPFIQPWFVALIQIRTYHLLPCSGEEVR